ncbi:MAG: hypothetical protein JW798_04985 [Prolixibacteraceae bacterium]|nr:hypothetical protein [Prolixibacteraceae bacterium]
MKPSISILFVGLMLTIFNGCKTEKTCPAFDPGDLSEFTYPVADTIVFENELSEKFLIFISEVKFSEPYTFECQDMYNICACLNSVEAIATDSKNNVPYTFLKMEQSDVSDMQYFYYNVRGFNFEFDFINELPYIHEMEHLIYHSSLTVGTITYNEVIEIRNLELSTANIGRVYFNKENGILRFIIQSTGEQWDLIP